MTTSDTIRIMLIKCKQKQIDICKELACSQQAFSNKMSRSSWTVSDLDSIVKLCKGKLLIELQDGSVLPLDPETDSVDKPKREGKNNTKLQSDSLSMKKAAPSCSHQKRAEQKSSDSDEVTTSSKVSDNIPEKHKQKELAQTDCLPEKKNTKSRKVKQIDGQQNMFDMLYDNIDRP